MVDPILTIELPISICNMRTKNIVNTYYALISTPIRLYPNFQIYQKSGHLLTACSKSPDMPIDSSHCSSSMPRFLQTSLLQFTKVCMTKSRISGLVDSSCLTKSCTELYIARVPWSSQVLKYNLTSQSSLNHKIQGWDNLCSHVLQDRHTLKAQHQTLLEKQNGHEQGTYFFLRKRLQI